MAISLKIISIFATDCKSGHLLLDDIFYYDLARAYSDEFDFYTSEWSKNNIEKELLDDISNIYPIRLKGSGLRDIISVIRSIPLSTNSKVIFLGYTEKFVLLFLLLNLFRNYKLILVTTNNISVGRVDGNLIKMKLFFRLIDFRLKKLVVHSKKEIDLCLRISKALYRKSVSKKHHLMIPVCYSDDKECVLKRPIISFFGPNKKEKPIGPLVDLIRADTHSRFEYKIYNVDRESMKAIRALSVDAIVTFCDDYLSPQDYRQAFRESALVLMSHDKSFEGKLSGNLCDCISLGVPFIASKIEPILSYTTDFGFIGFVFDFSDPGWALEFFKHFDNFELNRAVLNLAKMGEEFERTKVVDDNIRAIFT